MAVRKLECAEHGKTRPLWEEVFPEDTRAFLDYYYFAKTRDNTVYVREEAGRICSMVQLNPYPLRIGLRQNLCHYVVGVATKEAYRKRGFFREVFLKAMEDLYRQREPFVYLMPADPAIYTPFGFRFFYDQPQGAARGVPGISRTSYWHRDAGLQDARALAAFCRRFRRAQAAQVRPRIYACREETYFQRAILEQQSEDGGIRMVFQGDRLVGIFSYDREEGLEVLEPLFLPSREEAFPYVLYDLAAGDGPVPCFGTCFRRLPLEGERRVPRMMGRILCLEALLACLEVRPEEEVDAAFGVVDPLFLPNNRIFRLLGPKGKRGLEVRESEDSQGVLPVEALWEFLTGYRSLEALRETEGVVLTEALLGELKKIRPLAPVWLNEVV